MNPGVRLIKKAREISAEAAEDDYINRYMRLALYQAGKWYRNAAAAGIPFEDVQAEALLALCEAANNYPGSEAEKNGIPFRAYFYTTLRNVMLQMLYRAQLVRMPDSTAERLSELEGAKKQLGSGDAVKIAKELGWPVEQVREYLRHARAFKEYISFQKPILNDEGREAPFGESLAAGEDVEEQVLDKIERQETWERLSSAIKKLPPAARTSVILTFDVPAPEGIPAPTVKDVIGAALAPDNTFAGVRRLREREGVKNVQKSRVRNYARCGARENPSGKTAQHRAANFWRRVTGEQWFPWLQTDEPARAVGSSE